MPLLSSPHANPQGSTRARSQGASRCISRVACSPPRSSSSLSPPAVQGSPRAPRERCRRGPRTSNSPLAQHHTALPRLPGPPPVLSTTQARTSAPSRLRLRPSPRLRRGHQRRRSAPLVNCLRCFRPPPPLRQSTSTCPRLCPLPLARAEGRSASRATSCRVGSPTSTSTRAKCFRACLRRSSRESPSPRLRTTAPRARRGAARERRAGPRAARGRRTRRLRRLRRARRSVARSATRSRASTTSCLPDLTPRRTALVRRARAHRGLGPQRRRRENPLRRRRGAHLAGHRTSRRRILRRTLPSSSAGARRRTRRRPRRPHSSAVRLLPRAMPFSAVSRPRAAGPTTLPSCPPLRLPSSARLSTPSPSSSSRPSRP